MPAAVAPAGAAAPATGANAYLMPGVTNPWAPVPAPAPVAASQPAPQLQSGLPQFGPQQPQPNVSDFGRGINGAPMPSNPQDPSSAAPQPLAGSSPTTAPVDPYAGYKAAFQQYYDAAQGQIQAGLTNALGALGQRRDAASAVVASMPGQIAQQFANVRGIGQNAGAASDQAIGAQTMRGQQAAGTGIDPLANAAIAANASSGQVALNQQAMAGNQQLLQDRYTYLTNLAQQQMNNPKGESTAQLAQDASNTQIKGQETLAQFNNGLNVAAAQAAPDATYGKLGLSTGAVSDIRSSPGYKEIAQQVASGTGNWQLIQAVYGQNPQLLDVLKGDFPTITKLNTHASGGYSLGDFKPTLGAAALANLAPGPLAPFVFAGEEAKKHL